MDARVDPALRPHITRTSSSRTTPASPQGGESTTQSGLLRRINAAKLLDFAWGTGAFDASAAIGATGLTRSTVLSLCEELTRAGWLTTPSAAPAAARKGRPAKHYELHAHAGHVAAIDAGQHSVTVTLSDLRGTEVHARSHTISASEDSAEGRRRLVTRLVDEALEAGGVERVLAMTIAVPAPTNHLGDSPADHDDFWARMNPGFTTLFADHGWHVSVVNDANLAALGEGARGAGTEADSYVALLAGERFGAGLVVDGHLVRGASGGAGEMKILDLVDGVGNADAIGALGRTWGRELVATAGHEPSSLDALAPDDITAASVFDAARDGDVPAAAIVERLAVRLARVCAVIDGMLDVERIIVAGGVSTNIEDLVPRAQTELERLVPPPAARIVASGLGAPVVSIGATAHALQYVREHALEIGLG